MPHWPETVFFLNLRHSRYTKPSLNSLGTISYQLLQWQPATEALNKTFIFPPSSRLLVLSAHCSVVFFPFFKPLSQHQFVLFLLLLFIFPDYFLPVCLLLQSPFILLFHFFKHWTSLLIITFSPHQDPLTPPPSLHYLCSLWSKQSLTTLFRLWMEGTTFGFCLC